LTLNPAISKIQYLKIKDMYYGSRMKCWVLFGSPRERLWGRNYWNHGPFGGQLHADRGGLRFFHGLKELILVTSVNEDVGDYERGNYELYADHHAIRLEDEGVIEECHHDFKKYFEYERGLNNDCNIPQILVQQGKQKRDRWYMGWLETSFL
jgi:hypothetical protein